jgi:2-polyprenyl-3-methyl-5-hydroxy-6-metoxy-1,4-benzoquinol methylase
MRTFSAKELCHERLGDRFATALSSYDTRRRVETLIDDFLSDEMVRGKNALDVGCGLGFFSQRLVERGARVEACDIGPNLVEKTGLRADCAARVADAMCLTDEFGLDRFDVVVSSECIEHVPVPLEALRQMIAVLKPGGYLSISTPNRLWYPVVRAATMLHLRPFDGLENFSSWHSLRRELEIHNVEVIRDVGLHLFPFQIGLHRVSTWCDRHLQSCRFAMINICILGRKKSSAGTYK